MELSSPWPGTNSICIAETICPSIAAAWTEKQIWVGCTELSEAVQAKWQHAQLCIRACKKLLPKQLRNQAGWWRHRDELSQQNCSLTLSEYAAIMMELNSAFSTCLPRAGYVRTNSAAPNRISKYTHRVHLCHQTVYTS